MSNEEDNFYELEEEEDVLNNMPDEDDDDSDDEDIGIVDNIDTELDTYLENFDEKKIENEEEEEEEEEDDISTIETDDEEEEKMEETKTRVTFPILTKYEKNFILGFRTKQIANGSVILIDINKLKEKTPYNIAVEELTQGLIPFKVKRHLPNGTYEIWDIEELIIT